MGKADEQYHSEILGIKINALRSMIGVWEENIRALEYAQRMLSEPIENLTKPDFISVDGTDLGPAMKSLASGFSFRPPTPIKPSEAMGEAILAALEDEGAFMALTPLANRLKERGFSDANFKDGASFLSSISVTLNRLFQKERVQKKTEGGKRLYAALNVT